MGIGIDIIEKKRIEKAYHRFGFKFLKKFLNEKEIKFIEKIKNKDRKIEKIGSLFVIKEAVIKCFGNINFHNIEIDYDKNNKPYAIVDGKVINISLSHCKEYIVAVAIKYHF